MAEFQAKKLNANKINNGQKWEYGQSPSTETFNAPIEGCLYLQERSIKTEKELQNIKSVLLGNNQYVEIKTEDAYKSRITANVTNIFDDQYARVAKIQGDTVSTESGLKHAFIDSIKSTGKNLFDSTNEGFMATGYVSLVSQSEKHITLTQSTSSTYTFRWFPLALSGTVLVGKTINYTATWTTTGSMKGRISLMWTNEGRTKSEVVRDLLVSGIYTTVTIPEKPDWATNLMFAIYCNWNGEWTEGSTITYNDIMFTILNVNVQFEPYKESVYKLPVPVELPKHDSILLQEGKIIKATDTVTINGTTAKVEKSVDLGDWQLYTYTPNSNLACVYGSQIAPMGWGSDTPANSVGFSKGVYLTNTNYVTIGVWFHKVDFLAETGVDTSNATAINEYLSNNPLIIERQLQNPNTLPLDCPQYYTAWNNGTETVIQGETDNSEFGAMPTITQFYLGKVGE